MFLNSKLATRLGMGFGLVLLLLALVGYFGLSQMNRLSDLNRSLYRHPFTVKSAVLSIRINLLRMNRAMTGVIQASDPETMQRHIKAIAGLEQKTLDEFKIIEERFLGDMSWPAQALSLFKSWGAIRQRIISLARSGERVEATRLYLDESAAHLLKMNASMARLQDFAEFMAKKFHRESEVDRDRAYSMMYGIIAAAILVGFALTILIARSVVNPARQIARVSEAIANGDLSGRITYKGKDEIGQMADSLRRMLTGVIGEGQSIKSGLMVPFWTANRDLTITFMNQAAWDIAKLASGLEHDEIIGKQSVGRAFVDAEGLSAVLARRCLESGVQETADVSFGDGPGQITVQQSISRLLDQDGQPLGVMGVAVDITSRLKTQQRLQAALNEKEALLREVHHRVKNNLQIMSTLLQMKADQVQDGEARTALAESRSRIKAMALIHESLYHSEDISQVDLGSYLNKLAHRICASHGAQAIELSMDTPHDPVVLSLERAVPCGLVVNELVVNACKYASRQHGGGNIWVTLRESSANMVELSIKDDGPGLPPGMDIRNANGLGLQLVFAIVEDQLEGSIEVAGGEGACFTIRFSKGQGRTRESVHETS